MRILLVDDEFDATAILARLLVLHGQCEVRCVTDPLAALELVQEWRPDAIVVDLLMPKMDGYTLAQTLRQIPELAGCRIVALSGLPEDHERQARAGIDSYLLKPVASRTLFEALRGEVLQRAER